MAWRLYNSTGLQKASLVSLSSSVVDNDGYLAANSASKVPTQAAVKASLTLLLTAASNVWSGNNSYTGTGDFSNGDMLLPSGAGVLDELFINWDTTKKLVTIGDGVRARSVSSGGWVPFAFPIGFNLANTYTTTGFTLSANGMSAMIPIDVPGHMILTSIFVSNVDATLARTLGWDLYRQDQQTPVAGENTLTRVATSSANDTFTATVASIRPIACADTYLSPGVYWLVLQNRHATNTYSVGFVASGNMANGTTMPVNRFKQTTNPNGSTLDFVAATWSANSSMLGVRLAGKVFGQSSAF